MPQANEIHIDFGEPLGDVTIIPTFRIDRRRPVMDGKALFLISSVRMHGKVEAQRLAKELLEEAGYTVGEVGPR